MKKHKKIQKLLLDKYLTKIVDYDDLNGFIYIGKTKSKEVNRYFFITTYENQTKNLMKLIEVSYWKHSKHGYHYFVDTKIINGYSEFVAEIDDQIKQVNWNVYSR